MILTNFSLLKHNQTIYFIKKDQRKNTTLKGAFVTSKILVL